MPTPLDRRRFLVRSAASAAALLAAREGSRSREGGGPGSPPAAAPAPVPAVVRLGQNENPGVRRTRRRGPRSRPSPRETATSSGPPEFEKTLAAGRGARARAGRRRPRLARPPLHGGGGLGRGRRRDVSRPTRPTRASRSTPRRSAGRSSASPLDAAFRTDLAAMEARVGPATRLVYVCNPANPTGTVVDPAALRGFCERVSAKAVVVVDEAYRDYPAPARFESMLPLVKKGLPVVVTYTFSKLHGLAGFRVGYAMTTPPLAAALRKVRMGGAPLAVSNVAVAAASASLGETRVPRVVPEAHRRRARGARGVPAGGGLRDAPVRDELRLRPDGLGRNGDRKGARGARHPRLRARPEARPEDHRRNRGGHGALPRGVPRGDRSRARAAEAQRPFSNATFPPTIVIRTSVAGISPSGTVERSFDRTTTSASLPGRQRSLELLLERGVGVRDGVGAERLHPRHPLLGEEGRALCRLPRHRGVDRWRSGRRPRPGRRCRCRSAPPRRERAARRRPLPSPASRRGGRRRTGRRRGSGSPASSRGPGSFAKRGTSAGSRCCACSIRKRRSFFGWRARTFS